jgi:multisubunit Na+/H+ antiporter MnhF subunit
LNIWLAASIAMLAGLAPCTLACLRRDAAAALAALNVAGAVSVLVLVTLSVAFSRQAFVDLAVVLAPLAIGGSLAFVRYMDRKRER